ncbi:Ribosomal biogenesis protein LAS1L [Trichinella papuae]|uniref:Ribosomal biogenesis protein LAS1L n=1 Tax=Trichinella papuae TaxID=268474 RepID=A0A0V1MKF6_9BILA|nr:Ribosomal biogenesis protein LAS1L [Trichinella papuae]
MALCKCSSLDLKKQYGNINILLQIDTVQSLTEAHEMLRFWKLSFGRRLPLVVAATEALLLARVQDKRYCAKPSDRHDSEEAVCLQHLQALAVTRCINYINEIAQSRKKAYKSLMKALNKYNIPAWVVRVRHRATHTTLPPLAELRVAAEFCFRWLLENCWSVEMNPQICPAPKKIPLMSRKIKNLLKTFHCRSVMEYVMGNPDDYGMEEILPKLYLYCSVDGYEVVNVLLRLKLFISKLTVVHWFATENSMRMNKLMRRNAFQAWYPVLDCLVKFDLIDYLLSSLVKMTAKRLRISRRPVIRWKTMHWLWLYTLYKSKQLKITNIQRRRMARMMFNTEHPLLVALSFKKIAFEGIEMPPIKLLASLVDSYEKLWKLNLTRDEDRHARAFGINQKNGKRKTDWIGSLLPRNEQDCTVSCLCEQRRQVKHVDIDSHDEQHVHELDTLSEDDHPCTVEEMKCVVKQLFEA